MACAWSITFAWSRVEGSNALGCAFAAWYSDRLRTPPHDQRIRSCTVGINIPDSTSFFFTSGRSDARTAAVACTNGMSEPDDPCDVIRYGVLVGNRSP